MLTPICCRCRVTMRCVRNDFPVRDGAFGNFPSTYYSGDLWKCPHCEAEIVTGLGRGSLEGPADAMEFRYNFNPEMMR